MKSDKTAGGEDPFRVVEAQKVDSPGRSLKDGGVLVPVSKEVCGSCRHVAVVMTTEECGDIPYRRGSKRYSAKVSSREGIERLTVLRAECSTGDGH